MTGHAMKYVAMAQRVREELGDDDNPVAILVRSSEMGLLEAEKHLVSEYSFWRDAMERAARAGSRHAAEYLERTTWDLT